jgi:hypothetical protein
MKISEVKIFLEDYHMALISSSNDEQWLANTTNYPEIFQSYFKTKNNIDVVSNGNLIENIILYKNKNKLNCVPEHIINFEENKTDFIKNNIHETYQKTSYYANILEKLINEFSCNNRKFSSYKIFPFPEKEEDTYLPIKKFKMICNGNVCKATIVRGGLRIDGDDDMSNYFNKRIISKFMKTGYTDEIPDEKKNRRRLLFLKAIPLEGITSLSKKTGKYKLKFIGNQTVDDDENEFSITNEPIQVTNIGKI